MTLSKHISLAVAAIALSTAMAHAGDDRGAVGTWSPLVEDARYFDRTVLVLGKGGRFAAFVAGRPAPETHLSESDSLYAAAGSWELHEDGGELVLTFDNTAAKSAPGTTLYLQMLLLGDDLQPYPGMEDRSPLAATAWRRSEDTPGGWPESRASR